MRWRSPCGGPGLTARLLSIPVPLYDSPCSNALSGGFGLYLSTTIVALSLWLIVSGSWSLFWSFLSAVDELPKHHPHYGVSLPPLPSSCISTTHSLFPWAACVTVAVFLRVLYTCGWVILFLPVLVAIPHNVFQYVLVSIPATIARSPNHDAALLPYSSWP